MQKRQTARSVVSYIIKRSLLHWETLGFFVIPIDSIDPIVALNEKNAPSMMITP